MGAYLSQPNTTKTSSDGGNDKMSYGFSAMQGWRVSMEVSNAMNAPTTIETHGSRVPWRGEDEERGSWQWHSKSSSLNQNGFDIIVELSCVHKFLSRTLGITACEATQLISNSICEKLMKCSFRIFNH